MAPLTQEQQDALKWAKDAASGNRLGASTKHLKVLINIIEGEEENSESVPKV